MRPVAPALDPPLIYNCEMYILYIMKSGSMNTYIIIESITNLAPSLLEKHTSCARIGHEYMHMYMYVQLYMYLYIIFSAKGSFE